MVATLASGTVPGVDVYREKENEFKLYGSSAILSGKPDLVTVSFEPVRRQRFAIVYDVKTGKRRRSDWWQVLIYMLALPRCVARYKDARLLGDITYKGGEHERIPSEELTAARSGEIFAMLRAVGGDFPPKRTPSASECSFCDIGPEDCPERVELEPAPAEVHATEF